ncbi:MAG: metal dependent phosphohydrolase [uncultured bacterium]|nr:MAG: metal dependent phosphohydrolase [uncultured bacterium]KKT77105.1 MAG: Metal dependent phosphohydrolase [Candidatus Peregrinibacteria bacterium GW2011_GWA2_44_7]
MNRNQANQLLVEFHTPQHIRRHCHQVARVAEFLANALAKKGVIVNPTTAWIGGKIHDFVRVVDFKAIAENSGTTEEHRFWEELRNNYKGWHHADAGAEILWKRGEFILASIVKKHKTIAILSENPPHTWEEKLVYYADKRVSHDQIRSLVERLDEAYKRHHGDKPMTSEEKRCLAAIQKLEEEIFKPLSLTPDSILSLNKMIE